MGKENCKNIEREKHELIYQQKILRHFSHCSGLVEVEIVLSSGMSTIRRWSCPVRPRSGCSSSSTVSPASASSGPSSPVYVVGPG